MLQSCVTCIDSESQQSPEIPFVLHRRFIFSNISVIFMPTKWNILLSAKNDRFHNGDKSFSVLLRLRKMVFVEKITDASLWIVIAFLWYIF